MSRIGTWNFELPNGGTTKAVKLLFIITCATYILQLLFEQASGGQFGRLFALSVNGLKSFHLWQVVSYIFLHGSIWHILFNMFMLVMIGPEVERSVGTRHFTNLYFLSGIIGGLGWALLCEASWVQCVGASGAIYGILVAYATLYPNRRLFLFPFPFALKAWVLVLSVTVIQLLFLLGSGPGNIAYAAHLAGGLGGYLYTSILFRPGSWSNAMTAMKAKSSQATAQRNVLKNAEAQEEMDRLLEKIGDQGFQSLSEKEKAFLDEMSAKMRSRRKK